MAGPELAYKENHLSEHTPKWFAIYTRFKSEKEVARQLELAGIECYVPINRVVRQYTRKRKVVELPLLHCYVFVRIRKEEYLTVLQTRHVVRFIHFNKNLISIPDAEINLLRRICQEVEEIELQEVEFSRYKPVEVVGGNLTGIQGKLIDARGKNFLVELEHVGIGLQMEIDRTLLRPLHRAFEIREPESVQGVGKKYW